MARALSDRTTSVVSGAGSFGYATPGGQHDPGSRPSSPSSSIGAVTTGAVEAAVEPGRGIRAGAVDDR
jgi:hypothetical protein